MGRTCRKHASVCRLERANSTQAREKYSANARPADRKPPNSLLDCSLG